MREAECHEFLHPMGHRIWNLKHRHQRVLGSRIPPLKRQHTKQPCRSSMEPAVSETSGAGRKESDLLISRVWPRDRDQGESPAGTRELVGITFLSYPQH